MSTQPGKASTAAAAATAAAQDDSIRPASPGMGAAPSAGNTADAGGGPEPTLVHEKKKNFNAPSVRADTSGSTTVISDPLNFGQHRRANVSQRQMKIDHPNGNKRKLKKFYTRQNDLIDQFLGADDEEQNTLEEGARVAPKIKFAVNASFTVNFCLFVIQLYAAISTGSLSLFATTADAFMDLVSSFVMLITSRLAARPSIYKYPVGRTRIETIGIILFCALMTTVAIQLLIESGRTLGRGAHDSEELKIIPIVFIAIAIFAKGSLMIFCMFYRKYPSVHVFYIDHRNDIAVNSFGLIMAIVGEKVVWYLDPIGAICIALLILFSWVANAFEQVWLLVGKSAPRDFISKLIYMSMTHDEQILKVDTCRAYHAGQRYYVEVDIVMNDETPLRISHDVSQSLQRKLEGLADVERAFVHVDYEHEHDIHEEHKPLYETKEKNNKRTLREIFLGAKTKVAAGDATAVSAAASKKA
ncbi:hypothetical protein GGTG_00629 [Gaeumannomyces tritici R3-111a-1]|uniref:Uncharacterized protein n=2 Tax=Gaeumannomyces tritici (strain R3-111a-1) TaxID=644352 RepID=J3NH91_GAET3|nr:hypothetical protein GGTG_00629 [Gaeumannomyces tritici R3-111a-1]EJT80635.1 hypothetical protein GGTG_00629 [Gaeumannomyces tritici R3-111a-1]